MVNLAFPWLPNHVLNVASCGRPIRANAVQGECKHCGKVATLRPDPRTVLRACPLVIVIVPNLKQVGKLCDETGSLNGAKLIWADEAWAQLLGRSTPELISETLQSLMDLEYEMKNVRITLLMGWSPKVEKLAVYKVLG